MSYRDVALKILDRIPINATNQEQAQFAMNGINAIYNNDSVQGEQMANQILQNAGMTKEQAMQIVQQKLGHLL